MGVAIVPPGSFTRWICAIAAGCFVGAGEAKAFPATDASTPSIVETATPPTDSDLRHQLRLQTGIGAAAASGKVWTFVPALGADEFFTDNVLESPTNRRWDLVTVVTPSIAIHGDAPNAQLNLNYSPQFRLDARTPSQNGVTQQLAGSGQFTIIPDAFYIDARALAGGTPIASGFGGLGASLTPGGGQIGAGNGIASSGLSKQNIAQTTSFSVSPYLLHRFGDVGTAKLGYELNYTSISQNAGSFLGFAPTGGGNQEGLTNQVLAQFETGEQFAPYRYMVIASAAVGSGTGVLHGSSQDTITNQLGYAINRSVSIYGQIGYERLRFGGVPPTRIDDMTWGFGATYTPNADSKITVGYGHQDGTTGAVVSAYYALTARTRITARYNTGLQTDIGQLENQLNLAAFDENGNAVDATTGAPQFLGLSGVGVQNGLYRAKTFTLSASTDLDRDQLRFSLQYSEQTTVAVNSSVVVTNPFNPVAPPVGSTSQGVTGIASWTHSFREDLLMASSASYGVSNVSGAPGGAPGTGRQASIGASAGLQYTIAPTLVTTVRYGYFRRGSPLPDETIYQNVFLVGVNKQF
ncbi:MAG TPA: hypothetical protein VL614_01890 [Acetobacteraceae bacterium]|jgi:uncharacterized protein (PEP-CTERM system associated)|nr:hypothetical protein [Acetobacteraceae bacterium]